MNRSNRILLAIVCSTCGAVAACDDLTAPAASATPAAAETVAAPLSAPKAYPGLHKPSGDPEARDPFVVAIAAATSVLSEGGLDVHDYEWGGLQYALTQSRLPPERLRFVLDRLFRVAPWPTAYPELPLPEALRFRDAFASDVRQRPTTWTDAGTYRAEPVVIYQLPTEVRGAAIEALDALGHTAVMHLDAVIIRRRDDGAPIAVDLTLAESDCGWCEDGQVYTIGPDGVVLAVRAALEYVAYGYCC